MSAQSIYDQAPIGALIRYSTARRGAAAAKHKLAAWENNNNVGRFVRAKSDPARSATTRRPRASHCTRATSAAPAS